MQTCSSNTDVSFDLVPFVVDPAVPTYRVIEPDFCGTIAGLGGCTEIHAYKGIYVQTGMQYLALEVIGKNGKPSYTGQLFRGADLDGKMQYWGVLQGSTLYEEGDITTVFLSHRLKGCRLENGQLGISVKEQSLSEADRQFQRDAFAFECDSECV